LGIPSKDIYIYKKDKVMFPPNIRPSVKRIKDAIEILKWFRSDALQTHDWAKQMYDSLGIILDNIDEDLSNVSTKSAQKNL